MKDQFDMITIGGSAGSLSVITSILDGLPDDLAVPIVIVLHRLRNVKSEMGRLLSARRRIIEPEDKEPVRNAQIYLAPQNYHLIVEADGTFMLDYSELINYSRPSIDATFNSIADVYGPRALGILLSGANSDGARGLCRMVAKGGTAIVQDPRTAAFEAMPRSALQLCKGVHMLTTEHIINFILEQT
jgi:two-component system, chemotaxis family, protein-glutamate methylesterase/glutaminase